MTLTDSLSVLSTLMQADPDHRRMWEIEVDAITEVMHGEPINKARYALKREQKIYAKARYEAELKLALEGR